MITGEKVRQVRMNKKLTQQELANLVGVTRQTISLIEAGKYNPTLKLCLDIAISLGESLDSLFWIGENVNVISQFEYIFITDIGSTTTKGLLLGQKGGTFSILAEADVPTTVEKPVEDVASGVINVAENLSGISGVPLLTKTGKLKVPFLATSSAGGGLQIMVFGVSSVETGRVAQMTAYGAGGVILNTFTVDDKLNVIQKMRQIHELHPDMVLMAGGVEGGNIASIVRLARILVLANPTAKFSQNERIPLVFAGNTHARKYVGDVFEDTFDVHMVDNVRPSMSEMNMMPAKEKVHELFMENVMERAPGYSKIKKWVRSDIIPTPLGVENILTLYGESAGCNIVMVDIGGATTDIFSNILGVYNRTVAANTGMSYSISNVLALAGIENVMRHLDRNFEENFVRNYIYNKMLNPTYVPKYECEQMIEHAVAIEGIRKAWNQHIDMCFDITQIGRLDRRKLDDDLDPFQEVFKVEEEDKLFQLSDIDTIIGSGGIISHCMTRDQAFKIIADGFIPPEITKIAIDKNFKSPHLGVLSNLSKEVALEIFEDDCLEEIGYIVAPTGKIKENDSILTVKDNKTGVSYIVKGGKAMYLPNGGDFTLSVKRKHYLYRHMKEIQLDTHLPILLDCRGRGEFFIDIPLSELDIPELLESANEIKTEVVKGCRTISKGTYNLIRELPYKGDILVKKGDKVEPGDIVGQNIFSPPKIYIIDLRRLEGYGKKLTAKEIREGLMIKKGDIISTYQKIFKRKDSFLGNDYLDSNVRGEVIEISDNGLVVVREIQDYNLKPVKFNFAKQTGIKPSKTKYYFKYDVGDYVEKGQSLVSFPESKMFFKSPATGTIKEINTKTGMITIQYDTHPSILKAFVKGYVVDADSSYYAELSVQGTMIYGIIGFGHENAGKLRIIENIGMIEEKYKGEVIASFSPVNKEWLEKAESMGIAGVIAPSIEGKDWASFYGKELGVGLTGDEDIGFTFILTEGFGSKPMNGEYKSFLLESEGKISSMSGRTQIRAGVTRPMVIINE